MTSTKTPVRIDVVSDVVCPWCFIGKRRLEQAIALNPDIPVEVHYHPFFLNDWIPAEGISREQYLTTKFGSPERYKDIAQRVSAAAAEDGLVYAIDKVSRQPNTTDSHRLIHWAALEGKAPEMKQRLMELYFSEGADLSDKAVLVKAAADIGLDADAVAKKLDGNEDLDAVSQRVEAAKSAGIQGVPFFIVDNAFALSGAQAPDQLAAVIQRAANERAQKAAG
ncbi:DsbA family oxidoreductase [Pseudorhodoplanes sinuspersici]|uniref:Disulfide bond formation protein DsbA n=1 Tax=Pseudorhodoplanes sinuspersici TaxID=1235591 RepID=A0A1W6ZWI4_9HYPH|nr:DsbA family oxidoreductase [Pseudorhodoplanes sinuspersici]ARQ01747.1 disulfide bond formation protein DsbA [Pseudorhodoplanes sinuspersici]RKE73490.1 putative DsbA family dithiol-disulfide isomerase [Pseudorhodoplanes sinuspersici]